MTTDSNLQAAFTAVNERIQETREAIDNDFTFLLNPTRQRMVFNNRFHLYTDNRWISAGDANYGLEDLNSTENAGTGVTPLIEWENIGVPFTAGDIIRNIELRLRCNNTEITDLQVYIVYTHPDSTARWTAGFDNDGEIDSVVVYDDFYKDREGTDNDLTAAMNDRTRQIFDLDFTVPEDGELRVFVKPVGTITATRYDYMQTIINMEHSA